MYRQIRGIRDAGRKPRRIILPRQSWNRIQEYRRTLGSLSGPFADYLAEGELFGIEIWYGTSNDIIVE